MERAIRRKVRNHPYLYLYRNEEEEYWWCAVPFINPAGERKQRRRTFHDNDHGSPKRALSLARRWRDRQTKKEEVRRAMGDQRPLKLYAGKGVIDQRNPFGLVGITVTFRDKPLGGNFSVTANRGRKKWFSIRRYGIYGAYLRAVELRCRWIGIDTPPDEELNRIYDGWLERNRELLKRYGHEP